MIGHCSIRLGRGNLGNCEPSHKRLSSSKCFHFLKRNAEKWKKNSVCESGCHLCQVSDFLMSKCLSSNAMSAHATIAKPPLKRMDWHEHWSLNFLRQMSAKRHFHSQTPRVEHTWSLSLVFRTHCHRPGQSTSSSSPGESFGFGPQLSSVKSCSKPSEEGRWKSLEVLTKLRKSTGEHDVAW